MTEIHYDNDVSSYQKGQGGQQIKEVLRYYSVLFSTRNWRLVHTTVKPDREEEGPSMFHVPCKTLTHCLFLDSPKCEKCGLKIPDSIQTLYTLHNADRRNETEYFDYKRNKGLTP